MMAKKLKAKRPKSDPCKGCDAPCCKYIMIEIDSPDDPDDADVARWFVAHKGVSIRLLDGKWYVHISTPCLQLDENNRCKVYDVRPKICRAHPVDACERSDREECYDLVFNSLERFDKWLEEEYGYRRWRRK